MTPIPDAQELRKRVESELLVDILPFWLRYGPDEQFGGFHGRISNDLRIDHNADKGLILNSRILWTFSKAYRVYAEPRFGTTAGRAFDYLLSCFKDPEYGGFYWLVDYRGQPLDTHKKTYGQAFSIYALAEYFLATGSKECLREAIRLFEQLERTSHDRRFGGYFETYNRDWTLAEDQRLSEVDMDERKSMNTHLHILEAYTNLLRAWGNTDLRDRLRSLVALFLNHILDPENHHFRLFFDESWQSRSSRISFGHDIEGSWLLCEAAGVLGDEDLRRRVEVEAVKMADAVRMEAVDSDGGLFYESGPAGITDSDKHWWPQVEAVVGFLNACRLSGREDFFTAARNSWDFIEKFLIDRKYGEWFWKVSKDGTPSQDRFKVDPWKCPYHNSRGCFEVMERLRQ